MIGEGREMPPDWPLSVCITGFAGTWPSFDRAMEILASNYFVQRLVVILILFLWFGTRDSLRREHNQRIIICASIGMALGFLFAESLVLIQNASGDFWARPYDNHPEALRAMNLMAFRLPDSSFPSNAICGLAPVAFTLWFADRRVSVIVWTLVLIWGMGRTYVGIHYPIDIVGGIVIGCIAAILAMKLATALDRLITLTLNIGKRLYLA